MKGPTRQWQGLAAGVIVGAGLTVLIGAAGDPPAEGHQSVAPQADENRYRLHVWSTPPVEGRSGAHGAYWIDGWTGQVFSIVGDNAATEVRFPAPR